MCAQVCMRTMFVCVCVVFAIDGKWSCNQRLWKTECTTHTHSSQRGQDLCLFMRAFVCMGKSYECIVLRGDPMEFCLRVSLNSKQQQQQQQQRQQLVVLECW